MITCSVCGQRNDDLALLCSSCRGYLQSKVDNLDLFQTIWQLIENPRIAFKRIILARHKNYVYVLSSLIGVSMALGIFWLKKLAPLFTNLMTLVGWGSLIGVPLGLLFVLILSIVIVIATRLLGGRTSIRNTAAVIAYSSLPIVLSLAFVFPLEIAIFGVDFFGVNPPPMLLNPIVYTALLGFDTLAILWTLLLLFGGISVLTGFPKSKSLALTVIASVVPGLLAFVIKLL